MKSTLFVLAVMGAVSHADEPASSEAHSALDRESIVKTMTAIRPNLDACFAKYRLAGVATVELTIAPDGTVAARIAPRVGSWGDFAGDSPTGACIVAAVQRARFAPFRGAPRTISYPVVLGNEPARSGEPKLSAAAMETLQRAQDAYTTGRYADAIALAQRAKSDDPQRALRVIGASSCFLKDAHAAAEAWRASSGPGRKFIEYVCANNQVSLEAH